MYLANAKLGELGPFANMKGSLIQCDYGYCLLTSHVVTSQSFDAVN